MEKMTNYYLGIGQHQKIYKLAIKGEPGERENAKRALKKRGILMDKAGLVWTNEEVEKMSQDKRDYLFSEKVSPPTSDDTRQSSKNPIY